MTFGLKKIIYNGTKRKWMNRYKKVAKEVWREIKEVIDNFNANCLSGVFVDYPKEICVEGEIYSTEEFEEK